MSLPWPRTPHRATLVWKPWPELENHDLQQRGIDGLGRTGQEGLDFSWGPLALGSVCVSGDTELSLMQCPIFVPNSGESPEFMLFKCVARWRDQF